MAEKFVQLVYRQVISKDSTGEFEKNVFQYSYEEFKLKSQAYNPEGKFQTFTALKAADGRANSLHYKTGFAVAGFIEGLHKTIPGMEDNLGKPLSFETYEFELVESDLADPQKHITAIHYFTGEFKLLEAISDMLLLSKKVLPHGSDEAVEQLLLIKLKPGISISKYGIK